MIKMLRGLSRSGSTLFFLEKPYMLNVISTSELVGLA